MESKLSSSKKDGTLWETEEQALRYNLLRVIEVWTVNVLRFLSYLFFLLECTISIYFVLPE